MTGYESYGGQRCNRCNGRLRRAGRDGPEISSMVGMSLPMIERHCRFSGQRENALEFGHQHIEIPQGVSFWTTLV
jgi:hypothetical protein